MSLYGIHVSTIEPVLFSVIDVENSVPFRRMGSKVFDELQECGDTHAIVGGP